MTCLKPSDHLPASQLTLRRRFEVKVRRVAPEIVDIVDTTDHSTGKKPVCQRTKG